MKQDTHPFRLPAFSRASYHCPSHYTKLCEWLLRATELVRGREVGVDFCRVTMGIGPLGIGMFARATISAGEFIAEFRGPEISFEDAARKGEFECYPLQIGHGRYIDLEVPGCFFNHSCDPNAGLRGIKLFAVRDIDAGAEIRYDYSSTMAEDHFEMACLCGSRNCRRVVRDFKHLPPEVRFRYLQLDIVQPFIAKDQHADNSTTSANELLLASRRG